MADMGFLPDVRRLLDQTNGERQTMLFSATLDNDVKVLIDRYQQNPTEYVVAEPEPDLSTLRHRYIKVDKRDRVWLAADLITDLGSSIVFVRTRHGADRVARQLRQAGVKPSRIHGGRSQSQRDQALRSFAEGQTQALVATDVAARGIHVDGVACVIHYDPPAEHKDYVHRSGRTGRAGAGGVVVSLLAPNQVAESAKMQQALGIDGEVEPTPGRAYNLEPVAAPARVEATRSRGSGKRRSSRSGSRRTSSASRSSRAGDSRSRAGRNGSDRSDRTTASTESRSRSSTNGESSSPTGSTTTGSRAGKATAGNSNARNAKAKKSTAGNSNVRNAKARKSTAGNPKTGNSSVGKATAGDSKAGNAKAEKSPAGDSKAGNPKAKKKRSNVDKQRPKSKRSGKPRPKNRKNRPGKQTRRQGQAPSPSR